MPDRLVLDASAALAILRDEPAAERAWSVLASHVRARGVVSVPGHFWLEISNVLIRRYGHSPTEVLERLQALDEFDVDTVALDRTLWLLAIARAHRFQLSTYDATYLALAEALDGSLLTLDADLAAAAGARALNVGSRRLRETKTPYDVRKPGEVWAEFGDYLGKLRAELLGM
jgi:predicted nucleic acid-binding protein